MWQWMCKITDALPHFLGPLRRSLTRVLGSSVWKEHRQEQTFKGSISSTASGGKRGSRREGSFCVLGSWIFFAVFGCVQQDASAVSEASVTAGNSIVPHDFSVWNPQMSIQQKAKTTWHVGAIETKTGQIKAYSHQCCLQKEPYPNCQVKNLHE